jgi:hypothetical protein
MNMPTRLRQLLREADFFGRDISLRDQMVIWDVAPPLLVSKLAQKIRSRPQRKKATSTITLKRESVHSGPIPYFGTFPTLSIKSGRWSSVENQSDFVVKIVKDRYTTADCDTDGATVDIGFNESASPTDIGLSDALPVKIAACVAGVTTLPDYVHLKISYSYVE